MYLYIALYTFFGCLSFIEYLRFPAIEKRLYAFLGGTLCFLILWALASLRWKTGTDWDSYYDTFYYFSDIYRGYFEPGFIALVSGVRSFTDNYTVFLTIFGFLCLSLKFAYFLRFHKETLFTVVLLFLCYYFGDIFSVRQNLAISLTLFSTWFIITKKPLLFVAFVVIASTVHITTILYLVAYFVYWMKIRDRTFIILILISIFFGLIEFGSILMNLVLQVMGIEGFVGEKINNYLNESGEGSINTNNNPIVIYLLGLIKRGILIPVFIFIKNKTIDNDNSYIRGYLNLYLVGNMIYFLFAKDLAVFARASVPFLFFEIFLISYTVWYFRSSKKTFLIAFAFMVLLSASRFNALINSYYHLYVPYNTIFDRRIDRILE